MRRLGLNLRDNALNCLAGELGFGSAWVLVNHLLECQAGSIIIPKHRVGLADLKRRRRSLLTHRVVRSHTRKRPEGIFITTESVLAFANPVLCVRRQGCVRM